jgi:hypothetical protein
VFPLAPVPALLPDAPAFALEPAGALTLAPFAFVVVLPFGFAFCAPPFAEPAAPLPFAVPD